jgi:hypothetical protein
MGRKRNENGTSGNPYLKSLYIVLDEVLKLWKWRGWESVYTRTDASIETRGRTQSRRGREGGGKEKKEEEEGKEI